MFQDPLLAFPIGRKIPYGPVTVSKDDIIHFAEEYDPAFFHLDENAAKNSLLGGLAASGFHTCSLTMRMICDAYLLASSSQGSPEVGEIKWLGAVRPGDELQGQTTVVSARTSNSRPDMLIVVFKHETFNQKNEPVLSMLNTGFFKMQASQPDE